MFTCIFEIIFCLICHVVFSRVLASLYPETKLCLNNSQSNLIYWQKSIPYFEKQLSLGRKPLDVICDEKLGNITTIDII